MKTKTIIIDDEQKSRDNLVNKLTRFCPTVEVIGQADNVQSGLDIIKERNPHLVFLDIEMPDGTGFDLLEKSEHAGSFNVIFVTAHDNYAVKAFRYSAIDYLTKPIDPEVLIEAVEKARDDIENANISRKLEALLENKNGLEKIALPTSDGIQLIRVSNIIRCQSDGNYTHFFLKQGEKILITRTLKEYTDLLSEHGFHRIHHSHLINISYVERYVNRDGGYVVMEDGTHVEISRRKKDEFLTALFGK